MKNIFKTNYKLLQKLLKIRIKFINHINNIWFLLK